MAEEIERSFLVKEFDPTWGSSEHISQAYIPDGWAIQIQVVDLATVQINIQQGEDGYIFYAKEIEEAEDYLKLYKEGFPGIARLRIVKGTGYSKAFLTFKSKLKREDKQGVNEHEFELDSTQLAAHLYAKLPESVTKVRTTIPFGELKIEVDDFTEHFGTKFLKIEVEVPSMEYPLETPEWFGPEITHIKGISNYDMASDKDKVMHILNSLTSGQ